MKIAIGSDHRGYGLKERFKEYFAKEGIEYKDFGCDSEERVDYPDYAIPTARSVSEGRYDRGVLICGSGIGMSIAANRFDGVRGTLCTSVRMAELSRKHNDSNFLCVGAGNQSEDEAMEILKVWLNTEFEGGRHKERLDKIEKITAK